MSESDTRAAISTIFDIIQRRDFGRFATLIHDDIDWIIHGPIEVFPFAGARRGRAAVLEVMARIADAYQLESYKMERTLIDGDRAAMLTDASFKQRSTGRILRFWVANFLRFHDGRLIEFRKFSDSFDLVEQAVGHIVDV